LVRTRGPARDGEDANEEIAAMMDERTPFHDFAWTLLRVMAGLMFFSHGAQKLFGWFGGFGSDGGTAEIFSRFGAAGVLETFGGALLVLGLFTRPVALLLSGQMAVAYFWVHSGRGSLLWWENRGELAALYAFLWLFFAVWGAGPYSLDAWRSGRDQRA
jgi:putative oxidoreductase